MIRRSPRFNLSNTKPSIDTLLLQLLIFLFCMLVHRLPHRWVLLSIPYEIFTLNDFHHSFHGNAPNRSWIWLVESGVTKRQYRPFGNNIQLQLNRRDSFSILHLWANLAPNITSLGATGIVVVVNWGQISQPFFSGFFGLNLNWSLFQLISVHLEIPLNDYINMSGLFVLFEKEMTFDNLDFLDVIREDTHLVNGLKLHKW